MALAVDFRAKKAKIEWVSDKKRKIIIGILGGIGSGKSTVAKELVKLGCVSINADAIAHQVIKEPLIKARIADIFGDILDDQGQIDRHKLAHIAFADGDKLANLNKIVHPEVLRICEELIEQYNSRDDIKAIVLDMPLLAEVGWEKRCDKLIFVRSQYQNRLSRMRKKGCLDENKLKIRENFQISLDIKARISDIIVDNDSSVSELSQQIAKIFVELMQ